MLLFKKLKYKVSNELGNKFKKKPKRVAMYHFGRVGSTVVAELLNQHPEIKWDNELFQTIKMNPEYIYDVPYESNELKILKNRFSRTTQQVYGFETKAIKEAHLGEEFLNMDLDDYTQLLINYGFDHFILLKRKNMLKQLISVQRGIQSKKFHFRHWEKVIRKKVDFDPTNVVYGSYTGDLIYIFKMLEKQYSEIERVFNQNKLKFLILSYEEHIESNPKIAYNKICSFCGLENLHVEIKQHKIAKKDFLNGLTNPELVINYLKGTPYEWMLEK